MNLIITGHRFELSTENKDFISYKTQTKFQAFEARLHKMMIVVTQEKHAVKSECTVTSDFGEFFASSIEETMESSIEHTLTKITTEIKKKHDKITTHK
ncbi:MAG: HPF/RaiA family ribosome-associated protein [Brevinema sp.]